MGGGGGDAAPAESAASDETAPAPAAAAATPAAAAPEPAAPKVPDPVPPWVEAAEKRKKIPIWAVPVLVMLIPWAIIYALTLDPQTPTEPGPYELGATVYSDMGCAGCHGASGGGSGAAPALTNVATNFEAPVDQVTWVALGTVGYQNLGIEEYAPGQPVTGAIMPGHLDTLTAEQVMAVVLHERAAFSGEELDLEQWREGFEERVQELIPDQAAEYIAVLDDWEADVPEAP